MLSHQRRDLDNLDDLHFGIQQEMLYARATPAVPGAQVCKLKVLINLVCSTTPHPAKEAHSPLYSSLTGRLAAQWTGIVTSIAIEMLESGRVDAVVCVQSDENDRFTPKPVRATGQFFAGFICLQPF